MILSSSLAKQFNSLCLFFLHTSETCPSRTCPATASRLSSCLPQNFIRFKLNLWKKKKTAWTHALEKYTDMFSFAFKNTHTISGCLERQARGEGDFLILTQRAQRHTISPNYRARERWGGGKSKITQKIKSCLWKIWSTSQNTQTFPRSTFLRYAVISYGWPFLSLSVRLLSALSAQLSKAPQPPDLTSLLHSLV